MVVYEQEDRRVVGGACTAPGRVAANAENFPNKPVHILVPYAAGVR